MGQKIDLPSCGDRYDLPLDQLGEAMRKLTPLARRAVVTVLETGGVNWTGAHEMAGYGQSPGTRDPKNAARQAAYTNRHDALFLAALREQGEARIHSNVALGVSVLEQIANDPTHKDQFKAAVHLTSLNGIVAETQHRVIVEDNRTLQARLQSIRALATDAGLTKVQTRGLLLQNGVPEQVIDAEFELVSDASALPAPAKSAAGLEDLL